MLYRYYFQSQGFTVAIFRWLQQELFVLLWSIKYLVRFPTLLGTVTVIFMTVGEPDFYTPSQFHQPTCFWKLLKWGGKLVYYTPSPCKIFTQPSTILSSVVWVSALYIESLKYHPELRLLIWYFSGNCLIFCQFYTVLGEQNYPILCGCMQNRAHTMSNQGPT